MIKSIQAKLNQLTKNKGFTKPQAKTTTTTTGKDQTAPKGTITRMSKEEKAKLMEGLTERQIYKINKLIKDCYRFKHADMYDDKEF